MKFLAIGNIFESQSLVVDNFCDIDSETIAKSISHRISGAAIVVSAMAAYLHIESTLLTKAKKDSKISKFIDLLSSTGTEVIFLNTADESNILLTIYNAKMERTCYSYTPNSVTSKDLVNFDFSPYDAVFFCCLPYDEISDLFKKNSTIKQTNSIVIASGLSYTYFNENSFLAASDYLFLNRGELFEIFGKPWNGNWDEFDSYLERINVGKTSLIITMGADGVAGVINGKKFREKVETLKNIVHPGGAGDSFAVGFIYGILQHMTIQNCCKIGHRCAEMMLSVFSVEEFISRMLKRNEKQKSN